MEPRPLTIRLLVWSLSSVLTTVSLTGQVHQHQRSSSEQARFNDEWDRQYTDYQRRLAKSAAVRPGMVVADLGAGRGELTFELSKAVGPSGQVYANDIDPGMIAALESLRRERGLGNVTIVRGDQNDPKLPPGRVQAAFLLKVYHQLADPVGFLRATREQLRPGAELFIVDVDIHQQCGAGTGSVSDPQHSRRDALAAGFEILSLEHFRVVDWSLYQLVVRKPLD